jgi:hypothetical protein
MSSGETMTFDGKWFRNLKGMKVGFD